MAKKNPGYYPDEINSKKASYAGTKFDQKFFQLRKKSCGVVVMEPKDYPEGIPRTGRWDLKDNIQIASAVLVDYNYVLMCAHSLSSFTDNEMRQGKVDVVFFNEWDNPDAKSATVHATRPWAKLRGDLETYLGSGSDRDSDFAIVKIVWNSDADYPLINHMARLPDPANFKQSSLMGKKLGTIQQYTTWHQIQGNQGTHYSIHAGMGPVTEVNAQPYLKSAAKYCFIHSWSTDGASGSGVFAEDGTLVGIIGGCEASYAPKHSEDTFFLPMDIVYASTYITRGSVSAGQKMKDIYTYRTTQGGGNS